MAAVGVAGGALFQRRRGSLGFIGVVHLLPLPGAPIGSPGLAAVRDRALADADALHAGGVDAVIVENFGDAPFAADRVDPYTVAAMTRVSLEIRRHHPELPLGINVLRNDAVAALSVAAAVGAQFVRVNVHVGTMVTDQGLITGQARRTLLERNRLGAHTTLAADVHVKHGSPLGTEDEVMAARDARERGHADALVFTGAATGQPTDPSALRRVRRALPETPLWIGSGVTPQHLPPTEADAAIVGTWLHTDGQWSAPVDPARVRTLAHALRVHSAKRIS